MGHWEDPEQYTLTERTVATLRAQGVPSDVIAKCYNRFVFEAPRKSEIQKNGYDYYALMHLRDCQKIVHNHMRHVANKAQTEREIQAGIPWFARSRKQGKKQSGQKNKYGVIARFFRDVTGVDKTPAQIRAETPRIFHWMIRD